MNFVNIFYWREGWACNKKEIFTTTDRGITWKKVVYKINDIYKLV